MFNFWVWNSSLFNSFDVSIVDLEKQTEYNGYVFEYVRNIQYLWFRDVIYDEAQITKERWVIYNLKYWKQGIIVSWVIKWNNRLDLLEQIDTMKWLLSEDNKMLIIQDSNWKRFVRATVWDLEFEENHYNVDYIRYNVRFDIYESIKQFDKIEWEVENITSITYNQNIDVSWNTKTPAYIKLTINSISWCDEIRLSINQVEVVISEAISDFDVLIFDTEEFEVLLNWVDIPFSWTLQNFEVWNNELEITIDWVSVDYDLYYSHNPAFI